MTVLDILQLSRDTKPFQYSVSTLDRKCVALAGDNSCQLRKMVVKAYDNIKDSQPISMSLLGRLLGEYQEANFGKGIVFYWPFEIWEDQAACW